MSDNSKSFLTHNPSYVKLFMYSLGHVTYDRYLSKRLFNGLTEYSVRHDQEGNGMKGKGKWNWTKSLLFVLMAAVMIKLKLATFNADVFNYSIILPSSAFYYLLATFFWKIFAKDIINIRWPIVVSIILGIVISLTKSVEFHIGYGAVFTLLPFFVLGLKVSEDWINKIRNVNKGLAIGVLLLGIIPAVFFPYAIHSIRFTYERQGFTNIVGIGWRLVYYVIAAVMCASIINLCPNKESIFSRIGKQSILVYAASTFLSPSLYVLIDRFTGIGQYPVVNFIAMICFSLGITVLASMKWVKVIYDTIINTIYKIFI